MPPISGYIVRQAKISPKNSIYTRTVVTSALSPTAEAEYLLDIEEGGEALYPPNDLTGKFRYATSGITWNNTTQSWTTSTFTSSDIDVPNTPTQLNSQPVQVQWQRSYKPQRYDVTSDIQVSGYSPIIVSGPTYDYIPLSPLALHGFTTNYWRIQRLSDDQFIVDTESFEDFDVNDEIAWGFIKRGSSSIYLNSVYGRYYGGNDVNTKSRFKVSTTAYYSGSKSIGTMGTTNPIPSSLSGTTVTNLAYLSIYYPYDTKDNNTFSLKFKIPASCMTSLTSGTTLLHQSSLIDDNDAVGPIYGFGAASSGAFLGIADGRLGDTYITDGTLTSISSSIFNNQWHTLTFETDASGFNSLIKIDETYSLSATGNIQPFTIDQWDLSQTGITTLATSAIILSNTYWDDISFNEFKPLEKTDLLADPVKTNTSFLTKFNFIVPNSEEIIYNFGLPTSGSVSSSGYTINYDSGLIVLTSSVPSTANLVATYQLKSIDPTSLYNRIDDYEYDLTGMTQDSYNVFTLSSQNPLPSASISTDYTSSYFFDLNNYSLTSPDFNVDKGTASNIRGSFGNYLSLNVKSSGTELKEGKDWLYDQTSVIFTSLSSSLYIVPSPIYTYKLNNYPVPNDLYTSAPFELSEIWQETLINSASGGETEFILSSYPASGLILEVNGSPVSYTFNDVTSGIVKLSSPLINSDILTASYTIGNWRDNNEFANYNPNFIRYSLNNSPGQIDFIEYRNETIVDAIIKEENLIPHHIGEYAVLNGTPLVSSLDFTVDVAGVFTLLTSSVTSGTDSLEVYYYYLKDYSIDGNVVELTDPLIPGDNLTMGYNYLIPYTDTFSATGQTLFNLTYKKAYVFDLYNNGNLVDTNEYVLYPEAPQIAFKIAPENGDVIVADYKFIEYRMEDTKIIAWPTTGTETQTQPRKKSIDWSSLNIYTLSGSTTSVVDFTYDEFKFLITYDDPIPAGVKLWMEYNYEGSPAANVTMVNSASGGEFTFTLLDPLTGNPCDLISSTLNVYLTPSGSPQQTYLLGNYDTYSEDLADKATIPNQTQIQQTHYPLLLNDLGLKTSDKGFYINGNYEDIIYPDSIIKVENEYFRIFKATYNGNGQTFIYTYKGFAQDYPTPSFSSTRIPVSFCELDSIRMQRIPVNIMQAKFTGQNKFFTPIGGGTLFTTSTSSLYMIDTGKYENEIYSANLQFPTVNDNPSGLVEWTGTVYPDGQDKVLLDYLLHDGLILYKATIPPSFNSDGNVGFYLKISGGTNNFSGDITIPSGTYTPAQMATELQNAIGGTCLVTYSNFKFNLDTIDGNEIYIYNPISSLTDWSYNIWGLQGICTSSILNGDVPRVIITWSMDNSGIITLDVPLTQGEKLYAQYNRWRALDTNTQLEIIHQNYLSSSPGSITLDYQYHQADNFYFRTVSKANFLQEMLDDLEAVAEPSLSYGNAPMENPIKINEDYGIVTPEFKLQDLINKDDIANIYTTYLNNRINYFATEMQWLDGREFGGTDGLLTQSQINDATSSIVCRLFPDTQASTASLGSVGGDFKLTITDSDNPPFDGNVANLPVLLQTITASGDFYYGVSDSGISNGFTTTSEKYLSSGEIDLNTSLNNIYTDLKDNYENFDSYSGMDWAGLYYGLNKTVYTPPTSSTSGSISYPYDPSNLWTLTPDNDYYVTGGRFYFLVTSVNTSAGSGLYNLRRTLWDTDYIPYSTSIYNNLLLNVPYNNLSLFKGDVQLDYTSGMTSGDIIYVPIGIQGTLSSISPYLSGFTDIDDFFNPLEGGTRPYQLNLAVNDTVRFTLTSLTTGSGWLESGHYIIDSVQSTPSGYTRCAPSVNRSFGTKYVDEDTTMIYGMCFNNNLNTPLYALYATYGFLWFDIKFDSRYGSSDYDTLYNSVDRLSNLSDLYSTYAPQITECLNIYNQDPLLPAAIECQAATALTTYAGYSTSGESLLNSLEIDTFTAYTTPHYGDNIKLADSFLNYRIDAFDVPITGTFTSASVGTNQILSDDVRGDPEPYKYRILKVLTGVSSGVEAYIVDTSGTNLATLNIPISTSIGNSYKIYGRIDQLEDRMDEIDTRIGLNTGAVTSENLLDSRIGWLNLRLNRFEGYAVAIVNEINRQAINEAKRINAARFSS